jgi:hypothetical protein
MGGLAIPLVCMLAAAAEAGGRPPLGDEDKTMYRLLVQGSLGKGLVGEHPALASLGIRGLREGYQPSFTAVFPVQGEHLTDTRVLLVGLDWSGGENGLHGPGASGLPRVGAGSTTRASRWGPGSEPPCRCCVRIPSTARERAWSSA